MSFRPWSVIVAIGLAIAFLSASGQAQQQTGGTYWQTQTEQYPSSKPPPTVRVDIIEDQSAAEARKRREEESRQREIEDLAAQQGMNRATQAMNAATQDMRDYALYSTIFVGVGTFLLFVTLWLTWQANRSARAAVDVTREMGMKQLRGYVHATSMDLKEPQSEFVPNIVIGVQNFGQTPVRNLNTSASWKLIFTGKGGPDKTSEIVTAPDRGITLGPGKEVYPILKIDPQAWKIVKASIENKAATFVVYGQADYVDIFGEHRWSKFRYRMVLDDELGIEKAAFIICSEGNEWH